MTVNPNTEPNTSPVSWSRIARGQAILLASLACVFPLVAYVGWTRSAQAGLIAASVAFLVCWLPNAASLAFMGLLNDPQQSVQVVLGSMLLRMGLPLGTTILMLESKSWLVQANVLEMVLVFYLIALAVETLLSLWTVNASRARGTSETPLRTPAAREGKAS